MSASADVTLIVDAGGVIRDLSVGGNDFAGQDFTDWIGKAWSQIVTSESRPKVDALLRDAGVDADRRWRQVNHASKQGPDLPMLFSAVRVDRVGEARADACSVAFGRDLRSTAALQQRLVEAQQSMEREYWKFRHAETRYRHLFQVAGEAVMVIDSATQKVLEANPAAQVLMGEAQGNPVGATVMTAFAERSAEAVQELLASVRANGRADEVRAELNQGRGEVTLYASSFRQDGSSHFLVRIARTQAVAAAVPNANAMLLKLVQSAPDCLVLTDMDGRILSANAAFIELAQMTNEDQVRGESLDRWLGRTGVDLSVLISNLRQRESVRLFATTLRGELGSSTDVEISATMVPHEDRPFLGFNIRDVGRRLTGEVRQPRELPRSVSQLTELVGRVPLKDIVGETTDLIEQLCIEAALDLTRDNRASAAEMLGLSRQSLYVKLRRYGLGDLGVETAK
jgi:transcriptional regulator PpsR